MANELRLGNYIDGPFGIQIVRGIVDERTIVIDKDNEYTNCDYQQVHPLSLTPEILEKSGFVPNGKNDYDYDGVKVFNINYTSYTDGGFEFWLLDNDSQRFGEGFKYVHQLQNIYFAFTGDGLTVNL